MRINFDQGQPKAFCAERLIKWISRSQNPDSWADTTPLTLPPLQRNGVWRPRQVLDLWRSVLDGLPIGLFYIQAIKTGCNVVDPRDRTSLIEIGYPAWELFDGQQRMRALALGNGDPFAEGRCLWVRFTEDAYELLISSRASQPDIRKTGPSIQPKCAGIGWRSIVGLSPRPSPVRPTMSASGGSRRLILQGVLKAILLAGRGNSTVFRSGFSDQCRW